MVKQGATKTNVPKGMKIQALGDYSPQWDFKKNGSEINGVAKAVRDIKKGGAIKNDTRILEFMTDQGIFSLWEKTALSGLFDEAKKKKGLKFYVCLQGMKKIRGRKMPMYDFLIAW